MSQESNNTFGKEPISSSQRYSEIVYEPMTQTLSLDFPTEIETVKFWDLHETVLEVKSLLEEINMKMMEQIRRFKLIMERLEIEDNPTDEPLEITEVDDDQAREMIIEYMREHQEAWPQDISRDLKLDFAQVMCITRALLDEGVLGADDSE